MIASSYTLAAAVCSILVAFIGMPLGRRNCILVGDMLVIIGAALQASSWSVVQIILARIICGFGIGFISCMSCDSHTHLTRSGTVPTYMAEMSIESKERGPEVAVQCVYLISGVALGYVNLTTTKLTIQVLGRLWIHKNDKSSLVEISNRFPGHICCHINHWHILLAGHASLVL